MNTGDFCDGIGREVNLVVYQTNVRIIVHEAKEACISASAERHNLFCRRGIGKEELVDQQVDCRSANICSYTPVNDRPCETKCSVNIPLLSKGSLRVAGWVAKSFA